jgi:Ni,Fe-hydrogenase maturation factor
VDATGVEVRGLDLHPPAWTTTHVMDAEAVLGLAASLEQLPVEAYVVRLPAQNLGLGETLSAVTARAVDEAVERIVALLQR